MMIKKLKWWVWVLIAVLLLVILFTDTNTVERLENNCIDPQCSNHHGKDFIPREPIVEKKTPIVKQGSGGLK